MHRLDARLKKLEDVLAGTESSLSELSTAELYRMLLALYKEETAAGSDEVMAALEEDFFVQRMLMKHSAAYHPEEFQALNESCDEVVRMREQSGDTEFAQRMEEKLRTTSLKEFRRRHEEALERLGREVGMDM